MELGPPLRRVVASPDGDGRSHVSADGEVPPLWPDRVGIVGISVMWEAPLTTSATGGGDATWSALPLQPPDGRVWVSRVTFPAGYGVDEEPRPRPAELANYFDPERGPTFHRTDTIDVLYVASGALELELDDGSVTKLQTGDSVVQRGTWHGWRNPHAEPCVLVATMIRTTDGAS